FARHARLSRLGSSWVGKSRACTSVTCNAKKGWRLCTVNCLLSEIWHSPHRQREILRREGDQMGEAATLPHDHERDVVDNRTFILATRETGYRDVAAAVAELIDNSLQAGAQHVDVFVLEDSNNTVDERVEAPGRSVLLAVLDDGAGMDRSTLRM